MRIEIDKELFTQLKEVQELKDYLLYDYDRILKHDYNLDYENITKDPSFACSDDEIELIEGIKLLSKSQSIYTSFIKRVQKDTLGNLFIEPELKASSITGRYTSFIHNLNKASSYHYTASELEFMLTVLDDETPKLMELNLNEYCRDMLIANNECSFFITDFKSVETYIATYLTCCKFLNDIINSGRDIYEAVGTSIAPDMETSEARKLGKGLVLSLGYGMGINEFKRRVAHLNLEPGVIKDAFNSYRDNITEITAIWATLDKAIKYSRKVNCKTIEKDIGPCKLIVSLNKIEIVLKSGRAIVIDTQNDDVYGAKLWNYIVQGTGVDILNNALESLANEELKVVWHAHDEIIVEIEDSKTDYKTLKYIEDIITRPITYLPGLQLKVSSTLTKNYNAK